MRVHPLTASSRFYAKNEDAASALELKKTLIAYDRTLLVADPRRMEPKKFGGRGARARRQKVSGASTLNSPFARPLDSRHRDISAILSARAFHRNLIPYHALNSDSQIFFPLQECSIADLPASLTDKHLAIGALVPLELARCGHGVAGGFGVMVIQHGGMYIIMTQKRVAATMKAGVVSFPIIAVSVRSLLLLPSRLSCCDCRRNVPRRRRLRLRRLRPFSRVRKVFNETAFDPVELKRHRSRCLHAPELFNSLDPEINSHPASSLRRVSFRLIPSPSSSSTPSSSTSIPRRHPSLPAL